MNQYALRSAQIIHQFSSPLIGYGVIFDQGGVTLAGPDFALPRTRWSGLLTRPTHQPSRPPHFSILTMCSFPFFDCFRQSGVVQFSPGLIHKCNEIFDLTLCPSLGLIKSCATMNLAPPFTGNDPPSSTHSPRTYRRGSSAKPVFRRPVTPSAA